MDESLKILVRHAAYFHEDVRLQAIIALKSEYLPVRAISYHLFFLWSYGFELNLDCLASI